MLDILVQNLRLTAMVVIVCSSGLLLSLLFLWRSLLSYLLLLRHLKRMLLIVSSQILLYKVVPKVFLSTEASIGVFYFDDSLGMV